MSVSSLVDHRIVEWDLTLADWSRLCKVLGRRRLSQVAAEVFGQLTCMNFNVELDDARHAIDEALGLNRLPRDVRGMLEGMGQTLDAGTWPGTPQCVWHGRYRICTSYGRHRLSITDEEEDATLTFDVDDDFPYLNAFGDFITLRDARVIDRLLYWLWSERRWLWPSGEDGGPRPFRLPSGVHLERRDRLWQLCEGEVDRSDEHFELFHGSLSGSADPVPVAAVGHGPDIRFVFQMLPPPDGMATWPEEVENDVRQEVAFYLTQLNEPDPWSYAVTTVAPPQTCTRACIGATSQEFRLRHRRPVSRQSGFASIPLAELLVCTAQAANVRQDVAVVELDVD